MRSLYEGLWKVASSYKGIHSPADMQDERSNQQPVRSSSSIELKLLVEFRRRVNNDDRSKISIVQLCEVKEGGVGRAMWRYQHSKGGMTLEGVIPGSWCRSCSFERLPRNEFGRWDEMGEISSCRMPKLCKVDDETIGVEG